MLAAAAWRGETIQLPLERLEPAQRESLERAVDRGTDAALVSTVHAALDAANRTVSVEVNSTAQLATLIQANTGRSIDGVLLRYDGHAFTPQSILDELEV